MPQELLNYIPDDLADRAMVWATKLAVAVVIFLGFAVASVIAKKIICRLEHRSDPQKAQVLQLIGDVARIVLLVFGFVTALGTLQINVSALVAGLGLTGFALGFACRDALSNVLAGVMILIYHPFHRGDHVSLIGLEGTVVRIDLRYTTLSNETKTLLIPNSILLTNAISLHKRVPPDPAPSK